MIDATIMKKYLNSLDYIKAAVNNGILPPAYVDLSHQWSSDLGKLKTSVAARRAIDATLTEIHVRQAQEARYQRRGKVIGAWDV